jgi:hypothetical protein
MYQRRPTTLHGAKIESNDIFVTVFSKVFVNNAQRNLSTSAVQPH